MMQSNKLTVDETHSHGALSELIFLLRGFEARITALEKLLAMQDAQLESAFRFNRFYYELYLKYKMMQDGK